MDHPKQNTCFLLNVLPVLAVLFMGILRGESLAQPGVHKPPEAMTTCPDSVRLADDRSLVSDSADNRSAVGERFRPDSLTSADAAPAVNGPTDMLRDTSVADGDS